jgi:hypothetical protein
MKVEEQNEKLCLSGVRSRVTQKERSGRCKNSRAPFFEVPTNKQKVAVWVINTNAVS